MSTPSFASCLPRLALGLFLSSLALTGARSAAQDAAFDEAIDVRLVNVEVFVTDKQGNPVEGLPEKSFTLLEDGKRVDIAHFVELRPSEIDAEIANLDSDDEVAAAPSYLVLFLDDFAFAPKDRALLLDQMREYVAEQVDPDVHVAVASYDSNLTIHQSFTTDRDAALAAIDRLAKFNPRSTARYAERESAFRSALETLRSIETGQIGIGSVPAAAGAIGSDVDDAARRLIVATQEIDANAQQMRTENRRAILELSQLVNALGSLPGRKAIVHVSQGMAIRPWEELYEAIGETFQRVRAGADAPRTFEERQAEIDQRSASLGALDRGASTPSKRAGLANDLLELTALANASRVSFYTIRPFLQSGLPAEFSGSFASFYTPSMVATREANLRETAQTLAEATGGVSLAGGDLVQLIDRAERDFRGYYSLAYRPEPGRDPAFHEIKVKVKGRGQTVRYRRGFFEKPPAARFGDRATAALLLQESENPIGLEIDLVDARPESGGQLSATLRVVIPLEKLTLVPQGPGRWAVDAQIYLAASDPLGGTAPVQLVDLQIPVEAESEAEARSDRYGARMKILASPGTQRIAVGFVDRATGRESYVAETFELP